MKKKDSKKKKKKTSFTYAQAGVHVRKSEQMIQAFSDFLKKLPKNRFIKSSLGGYASIYQLRLGSYLAASTDGVGTKVELARIWKQLRPLGQDLVAMCVNDLLCVGARPLFFLDYFASGRLKTAETLVLLQSIAQACADVGGPLVGGETAEMPGVYQKDTFDLAGFSVGLVSSAQLLPRKIHAGDLLLGIPSSGFHSNGYTWIRKALSCLPKNKVRLWKKHLLAPTRLYGPLLLPLMEKISIHALAHITGGGLLNLLRLAPHLQVTLDLPPLEEIASVMRWLWEESQKKCPLSLKKWCETFNMGIGMGLMISPRDLKSVLHYFQKKHEKVWILGEVVSTRAPSCLWVRDWNQKWLQIK